ncbi:MAG: hypothetical protein ACK4V2_07145 [Pseudomonadota bacterium]
MFIIQKICLLSLLFMFGREVIAQDNASNESYLQKIQRRYIPRLPYLMVPALVVPIIKKGALAGHLTIMVEIKSAGVEEYRKLQADLILIRDEIFCDLYNAMARLWLGPKPPSADTLERRIQNRINKFYGNPMVEKALLHVMQLSLIQLPKKATVSL